MSAEPEHLAPGAKRAGRENTAPGAKRAGRENTAPGAKRAGRDVAAGRMKPARDEALDAWSELHGGIDPRQNPWVRGWVLISHWCARPLARLGVSANTVTVLGVVATATALCLTILGGWWPLLAALVILVAALLDGVDGAIAAQTRTASRWGRLNDAVADRCSDVMLIGIVVVVGAPSWLGVSIVVLTLILETTRATAQAVGMTGPGAVTVWERPSRVILAIIAALCSTWWWATGLASGTVTVLAAAIAVIGAVLAVVGTVQLGVAVRKQTRRLG